MAEPSPELDLSALVAQDVPPSADADAPAPDHTASREPRRNPFGKRTRDESRDKRSSARSRKTAPRKQRGVFVEPLEQMYGMLAMGVMLRDPQCAQAIAQSAHQCAVSLDELAYQNDAVRRMLTSLVQTNALGAVVVAHFPILLTVARHHVPAVGNAFGDNRVAEEQHSAPPTPDGE